MKVYYGDVIQQLEKWFADVKETQSKEVKNSFNYTHSQICMDCIANAIEIVNDNIDFESEEEMDEFYKING